MGNFKHQSLRSGDRERDRDGDRDREIRDKEGLRHVGASFDFHLLLYPTPNV